MKSMTPQELREVARVTYQVGNYEGARIWRKIAEEQAAQQERRAVKVWGVVLGAAGVVVWLLVALAREWRW